jgi:hypothetical protein
METMQDKAIRLLAAAGYTATPDGQYNGGWLAVLDPVRVMSGSNTRIEYKRTRVHTTDVFKFLNERA